jgi:8-oxo-dGTP pyrophosphatase MutT (NUDIX family)
MARGQGGPAPEGLGLLDALAGPVNSAVLAVLFDEAGEARLVLTRRSSALRSHTGQVSFPGGRLDPGERPPQAALREAFEEVALDPETVRLEGWMHPVATVGSGSVIMPIVASVGTRPRLVASPAEVDRVFDVSLRELADPTIFHEEHWTIVDEISGTGDRDHQVWFFEVQGELIWGATARMLHELLGVVLGPFG